MKKIHIEVNLPLYSGDICGFYFKESIHDSEVQEMTPVIERRLWRLKTVYPGTNVTIYDDEKSGEDTVVTPENAVQTPVESKRRKKKLED